DSPFEIDVLKMILAKGYKVTPQVKVGGYRIDFVVEGIRDRLAVECDGERWHGPEKFEEDMHRQESLERAGWKFWRIRCREFYFNRKKAMESLWQRLDKMGIEPNKIEISKQDGNVDLSTPVLTKDNLSSVNQSYRENVKNDKQLRLFGDDTEDNKQMSLFDKQGIDNSLDNSNDWLTNFLASKGLNVIDKRDKGGNIWVV